MRRLLASRFVERAQELGAAIWQYWSLRGYLNEGRNWLDQILACWIGNRILRYKFPPEIEGKSEMAR